MPNKVFSESFTKFEWVCVALLEFKSQPKFDEGIFESYVHVNLVVLEYMSHDRKYQNNNIPVHNIIGI